MILYQGRLTDTVKAIANESFSTQKSNVRQALVRRRRQLFPLIQPPTDDVAKLRTAIDAKSVVQGVSVSRPLFDIPSTGGSFGRTR